VASSDKDRRAPVLSQHELQADPLTLREMLREIYECLADADLDGRTRRKTVLLIAALTGHWSRRADEDRIALEIERTPARLLVTATASEGRLFWDEVGRAAAPGLADTWGVDRGHSAAWFEITRPIL
jgi:hypothetical protein